MPRLPAFFEAPAEPRLAAPLRVEGARPAGFALRVLLGAKRFTLPAALLLIAHMIGEALVPVIVGLAIDRAIATGDAGQLLFWLAVLGADFLLLSFAYRFGSRIGLYGMQQVQHRLRTQVTDRLLHPAGVAHGQQDGAALSIATSDVSRLASVMQIGVYPPGEVAAIVFASTALFALSPGLGLATAIGAAALIVSMFVAGRTLSRRELAQQALAADSVGRASDLLAGYRLLKGLRAEAEAGRRYREVSRAALGGTLRSESARGVYTGVLVGLAGVFIAGLTVLAGVLAVRGELSIGGLIAAVGLVQFVVGPLTNMPTHTGAVWAAAVASATRVLSVLQAPLRDDKGAGSAARTDVGVLELRMPGLTLDLAPGECVGVTAQQLDAQRLHALLSASPAVPEHMLVAPHRAELFDGTLAWNLDTPGADADTIPRALHAAACDDILEAVPQGIETEVGEGGSRLSGGQRQRLALARAYAAEARVLVLHDPTTAVDAATEQLIAERLRTARGTGSTLLITSSPALLAVCDRVVALEHWDDAP